MKTNGPRPRSTVDIMPEIEPQPAPRLRTTQALGHTRLLDAIARLYRVEAPEAVLDLTLDLASDLIPVHQISIATNEGDHVLLHQHRVDGVEAAQLTLLPLDDSISGLVIRGGAPCRCDDLNEAPPMLKGELQWAAEPRPRTVLSVPLTSASGQVLAALNLFDRIDGAPFSDVDQHLALALVLHAGIALEKALESAGRQKGHDLLSALVEHSPEIVCILDADGTIRYESPSLLAITGFRPEAIVGRSALDVVHPEDAGRMRHYFTRAMTSKEPIEPIEYRVQYSDGSWHYLEAAVRNLLDHPVIHGVLVTSRDVTERKGYEDEISRHALTDPLTGLPSRALFLDRLGHALDSSQRRQNEIAVMLLELAGFPALVEALGPAAADALLVSAARRTRECLRLADTVARLSGGQFALLFEDLQTLRGPGAIVERLLGAFQAPFAIDGESVPLDVNLGISIARPETVSPAELLNEAETALYRARAAGRGQYLVFQAAMSAPVAERGGLERELRDAVDQGQLVLHYQPEVELRTGRILGVEALVRWQHPTRGLLLPASFIQLAEECGAIVPLGSWVLEEACRQAKAWQQFAGRRHSLVVGVNLSVGEFQQPGIVEKVARVLRQAGLHPRALRIEITESTMMHAAESTVRTLRSLKDLGVGLAIDDFGTGYSSLSYLRQFPVDTLKIDQSFVGELDRRPETREIVRAVTRLARALNMEVTAEGIETAEQRGLLDGLHCRRGQGHLFWHPLPGEEITALLHAQYQS